MDIAKEKRAIQYLKSFEPVDEPYYGCYSGGKDSDCIKILLKLAGVKHELHHNLTTVDAPETVRYIKSQPEVIIHRPEKTMWQLIVEKKIPPTRLARYCCERLKEGGGKGRMKVTGVRWDESENRRKNSDLIAIIGKPKTVQKMAEEHGVDFNVNSSGGLVLNTDNSAARRFVESCYRTTSTLVNPIVDWTTEDVWDFLHHYGCESNPLYKCGEHRIGCILCPMSGFAQMKKDAAKYPKYKAAYIRAFDKMVAAREAAGLVNKVSWADGESVYRWWIGDDPNQYTFEDLEKLGLIT